MLIPGIIISTLLNISLSIKYYNQWESYGNEKYIVFFVMSYLYGILFQQIGNMIDRIFVYKIIYGGKPREVFLLEDKYHKILNNELAYKDALTIKNYMIHYLNINTKDIKTIEQKKQLSDRIFSYCLNIVEMNGLSYKADKMLVISEMSRSLSLGCIAVVSVNMFMVSYYHFHYRFYIIESIVLLLCCVVFWYRKIQYERYRHRIVLRMFLIYLKDNTISN